MSGELHLREASTVPLGAPAGRPRREQLLVLGPEGRPAPLASWLCPWPRFPPSTPVLLPASRGESVELCQVWLCLCGFLGRPGEAG